MGVEEGRIDQKKKNTRVWSVSSEPKAVQGLDDQVDWFDEFDVFKLTFFDRRFFLAFELLQLFLHLK